MKTPEGMEVREITCLSSQMKQGISDRIKKNLSDLSKAKQKRIKVGKPKCELLLNKLRSFLLHSWMSRRLEITLHSADRASSTIPLGLSLQGNLQSTGFSSGSSYPTTR